MGLCVCVCACVCVRASVRPCVCVCGRGKGMGKEFEKANPKRFKVSNLKKESKLFGQTLGIIRLETSKSKVVQRFSFCHYTR